MSSYLKHLLDLLAGRVTPGNGALDIGKTGRGTGPVTNNQVLNFVKSITAKEIMRRGDGNWNLKDDFVNRYLQWIKSSTLAPVSGLDQFKTQYYVNGVTQAYDIFLSVNKNRRFRTVKGEYPYVRLAADNWLFLEDDDIQPNDAVALSAPFYADDRLPDDFNSLLDSCLELKVPVFIDAAYFGTCYGVSFDYSHPAIQMLGFSLSKPFAIQSYRVGMLLTKHKIPALEEIQIEARYFNRVGAYVGLRLMERFSADYIPFRYRGIHADVCYRLGLLPTSCIMIGSVRNEDSRFDDILKDDRFDDIHLPEGQLRRVAVGLYLSDKDPFPKKVIKRLIGR